MTLGCHPKFISAQKRIPRSARVGRNEDHLLPRRPVQVHPRNLRAPVRAIRDGDPNLEASPDPGPDEAEAEKTRRRRRMILANLRLLLTRRRAAAAVAVGLGKPKRSLIGFSRQRFYLLIVPSLNLSHHSFVCGVTALWRHSYVDDVRHAKIGTSLVLVETMT